MNKLTYIPVLALSFTVFLPATSMAYKYDPEKEYTGRNYNTSIHSGNLFNRFTFYKQPVGKRVYTRSSRTHWNRYPQVTKAELQKLVDQINANKYNGKAPTGNYASRAFMSNK